LAVRGGCGWGWGRGGAGGTALTVTAEAATDDDVGVLRVAIKDKVLLPSARWHSRGDRGTAVGGSRRKAEGSKTPSMLGCHRVWRRDAKRRAAQPSHTSKAIQ
jgi:hypothetical protein